MNQRITDIPPLALTMGEPAGIGPELALKVWHERQLLNPPPFVLIASKSQIAKCCYDLGFGDIYQVIESPVEAIKVFQHALPLLPLETDCTVSPGRLDPSAAKCVISSIERAVHLALSGAVSGIVTNPIHKKNLYDSGFGFPGHTEFLAHLMQENGAAPLPVMMLQGGGLRAVPVTIHIALADVPCALTTDLIVKTAEIVHHDLVKYFALESPRLVVAGLNPHAGEGGALGMEDETIIKPAIKLLKSRGLDIYSGAPSRRYDVS